MHSLQYDDAIKEEMLRLMEWDVLGKTPADIYTPAQMDEARALIAEEMQTQPPPPLDASLWTVLRECSSELIMYQGRFTRLSNLGRREQAEALANKFRVGLGWAGHLKVVAGRRARQGSSTLSVVTRLCKRVSHDVTVDARARRAAHCSQRQSRDAAKFNCEFVACVSSASRNQHGYDSRHTSQSSSL